MQWTTVRCKIKRRCRAGSWLRPQMSSSAYSCCKALSLSSAVCHEVTLQHT